MANTAKEGGRELVPSQLCLDLCVFVCLSSRLISHNFWRLGSLKDQAANMAEF